MKIPCKECYIRQVVVKQKITEETCMKLKTNKNKIKKSFKLTPSAGKNFKIKFRFHFYGSKQQKKTI